MALSFFSGGGSASNAKYFDIRYVELNHHYVHGKHLLTALRLNEDYIVFRGGEHEAASAHLKGTLVLCLSEPLAIKHIRLELTGMSRVWYVAGSGRRGNKFKLMES